MGYLQVPVAIINSKYIIMHQSTFNNIFDVLEETVSTSIGSQSTRHIAVVGNSGHEYHADLQSFVQDNLPVRENKDSCLLLHAADTLTHMELDSVESIAVCG